MRRRTLSRGTLAALTFTLVLGLGLPVAANQDVPFVGIAVAEITGAAPDPDGVLVSVSATGRATHLGQFTRTEEAIVHADGSVTGWVDFKAANGDHLLADIDGGFVNATDVAGSYVISGGTGRFEGAQGEAEFLAESSDGVHYNVHFSGDIDF